MNAFESMQIDLTGTNILITGASRGIGRAMARAMGAAGARIGIHCNHNVDKAQSLADDIGGGARVFRADLEDAASTERLFEEVVDVFGRVDVLVNNAGIALQIPLDAPTKDWLEAWQRTMAVNLRAVELLCRLGINHFKAHGGGRIINIASRAAFRGDEPDFMAYAASKGGVVALTRSIARGFGKDHICAFVLAPGYVRTDMAQDFIDVFGEAHAVSGLALDRLTEPEDLAPMAVLLASGLADHATGCTIDLNAGSYVH